MLTNRMGEDRGLDRVGDLAQTSDTDSEVDR